MADVSKDPLGAFNVLKGSFVTWSVSRRGPSFRASLLAVAVVVGPSTIGVEQAPAACAVEADDDGTVTVEVRWFEDADGLERQLEAHGIAAEVDYTLPDKYCQPRFEGMAISVLDGAVTTDIGENFR